MLFIKRMYHCSFLDLRKVLRVKINNCRHQQILNSKGIFVVWADFRKSSFGYSKKTWFTDLFGNRLLGEENGVNVGQYTTRGNGYTTKELVQLFIILDCKGNVTRYNTTLLVVTSGISSKLKNFSCKVFENSCKVNWCTSTNTCGVLSFTNETSDTTYRELQASLGR